MQANIILFVKGSAGNFLARVLSLDENTVPIGGVEPGQTVSVEQRAARYNYCHINRAIGGKFNKFGQAGLSNWVDIELNQMYFPLTLGVEQLSRLNLDIVEPVHPLDLESKLDCFSSTDVLKYTYVDITDCIDWVVDHKLHKGVYTSDVTRSGVLSQTLFECTDLKIIHERCQAEPISLKKIINSADDFLSEYKRVCQYYSLTAYPTHVLNIYQSWKTTWPK